MLRSGQMILAEALIRRHLGRGNIAAEYVFSLLITMSMQLGYNMYSNIMYLWSTSFSLSDLLSLEQLCTGHNVVLLLISNTVVLLYNYDCERNCNCNWSLNGTFKPTVYLVLIKTWSEAKVTFQNPGLKVEMKI